MLNSCLSFYLKASLKSRTAANRLAPCRAAGTTPQPSTAQGWFEQLLIGQPLAALIALPALGHGLERMKRLARENAMLRNMIDMAADLVVMVHDGEDDGRVVYANDAACRHFGVDRETLLTWRPEDWDVGLDAAGMAQVRARSNMQGKYAFETRHRVAGNAVIPVEVITHPFQHEGECFSVSIVRDLRPHLAEQARRLQAERHSAESEGLRRLDEALRQREDEYRRHIHRLAFFDSLTELPNRSRLSEQLCQAIEQAARHDQQFGLMLLDLDHFKMINDTLGHAVGDQLLCLVAERLQACVRNCDTVARLGGDEFAVLLPDVRGNGDLSRVAGRIIEAFGVSFSLSGKEFFVSSSIGIALYPADSADMDALFKYADLAMYAAKQRGRNNYQFYCSELTERSTERMTLEMALRKAMANDELELYYQPLADVCSGRIVGAEALLRWNRGELGLVAPDSFIAVAEATGLIVPMGEWVLATACRAVAAWNDGREVPLRVAVNLSTRQFLQNDLLGTVRHVLEQTRCRPEWLKLEVTESLLLEDSESILATLNGFRELGLGIAIDDFGTGYSALSYLNRFPVTQIKIDRSFISHIPHAQNKAELVKAMISIARALNMELVAEGVETRQQADYLLTHGCMLVQGYLFGKPMPDKEFTALLT